MQSQTEDRKGYKTVIKIDKATFDELIDESYFTRNALR